jgi:glycosyltransferase involved in cell wall biosynthesis
MNIILLGPCSPQDVLTLLHADQINAAQTNLGYRGAPVSNLAIGLVRSGHVVSVVTSTPNIPENFSGPNFYLYQIQSRRRAKVKGITFFSNEVKKLTSQVNMIDADLVHAHWTYEFALAAIRSQHPHLVTIHDNPYRVLAKLPDSYRFLRLLLALKTKNRIRNATSVSEYLASDWNSNMNMKIPLTIIPNLIQAPSLSRSKNVLTLDERLFVTSVGNSSKLKNIKTLIKSWSEISGEFPNFSLVLIGSGLDSGGKLNKWAEAHTLDRQIMWLGEINRERIEAIFSQTKILVHPSLEESQGMALVEAMSFGVPVIAGEYSGAIPETLGESGLLTDVTDFRKLSVSIASLLKDTERLQQLSNLGLSRYSTNFSPDVVLSKYLEKYKSLISNSNERM